MATDCSISGYIAQFQTELSQALKDSSPIPSEDPEAAIAAVGIAVVNTIKTMSCKCRPLDGSEDCTPPGYCMAVITKIDLEKKAVDVCISKVSDKAIKNLGIPAAAGCAAGAIVGGAVGAIITRSVLGGVIGAVAGCKKGAEIGPIIYNGYKITSKIEKYYNTAIEVKDALKEHSNVCRAHPLPPPGNPNPPNPPTPSPSFSKHCQTGLVKERLHDRSLNPFAPKRPPYSLSSYSPFSSYGTFPSIHYPFLHSHFDPPYASLSFQNKSFMDQWRMKEAVRDAVVSEMRSYSPNIFSAYMKACSSAGLGCLLSYSEFRSIVSSTNLISSYNSFNPEAKIRDVVNFCSDIGGVGNDVSIIEDMINSEVHAEAQEYFFCFPSELFPFSPHLIKQLERELAEGYFNQKTVPFFSLHFNDHGFMYPVIHPAYQDTLTGEIIALLDYWMKGFLNGGIFDEDFLKNWHVLSNCDEANLRGHLIDLKKYCKEHQMSYVSLRELMHRYGLKEEVSSSHYKQPFMTSFRIIAFQEKIERRGNLLIPHPTFRVEYSIDLMPDYKNYLDSYCKEHGCYPEEYQKTRLCYELLAKEIKEKLPQMPFCRDFFRLLGMMNFFCYFYATLKQMGKRPVLEPLPPSHIYPSPKAFPPIPIRYFRTYPLAMTLGNIINQMHATDPGLDQMYLNLFANKRISALPSPLTKKIQQAVTTSIQTALTQHIPAKESLHEEEVERIAQIAQSLLRKLVYNQHRAAHLDLNRMMTQLEETERKTLLSLNLIEKIKQTPEVLKQHLDNVILRWMELSQLPDEEIIKELPQQFHQDMRDILKKIEEDIQQGIIAKKIAVMEAAIQKMAADKTQHLQNDLNKLTQAKNNHTNAISQATQAIQSNERQVSAHSRTLNQASTKAFINQVRQQNAHINNEITATNAHLQEINNAIAVVNSELSQMPTKVNAIIASAKADITRREATLWLLKLIYAQNCERVKKMEEETSHFTNTLLTVPEISENKICEQYTHALVGFTGQEVFNSMHERFKIIGGCGMSLPNITSSFLENGEAFYNKVTAECPKNAEEVKTFSYYGKSYTVFRLPIADQVLPAEPPIDSPAEKAMDILEELAESETPVKPVLADISQAELDHSGAKLVHYAAALLEKKHFARLLSSQDQIHMRDKLGHLPIHVAAYAGNVEAIEALVALDTTQLEAKTPSGATPLILSVQYGKIAVVEKLISLGAQVNTRLPNGLFPLYLAIQNNFPDIALLLMERGISASLSESLDSGMTPLHLAIDNELPTVALKLIQQGANLEKKRKADGYTPWHCAASLGQLELMQAMIKRGLSPHQTLESKKTALHLAAEAGHADAVAHLLTIGLDVNAKTTNGETPLMLAIKKGHADVALVLATQAAVNEVNEQKQTSSLLALQYGMPLVGDALLMRGEDPKLCDLQGYNYIYYLVRNDEYDRISLLASQKAMDLNQTFQGESLSTIAAKYGHFLLTYALLDLGVEIKSPHNKWELINYATMSDEVDLVREWLMNHKINEGDQHGKENELHSISLAYLAAKHGSKKCLALLLGKLSTKEIVSQNLLSAALESNNEAIVRMVLRRWEEINKPLDPQGNTALHYAVRMGSASLVALLIKHGSRVDLCNHAKQTPMHIALHQDDHDVLKKLLKCAPPEEWPQDLETPQPSKISQRMGKVLEKYRKLLPKKSIEDHNILETPLTEKIAIPEEQANEDLQELKALFEDEAFEEAADFLEQKPTLLTKLKSPQGGTLLKLLFENIFNYSRLLAISNQKDEKENALKALSPDRLLGLLQSNGINPADFKGKDNVLLGILKTANEEEACYRLDLFSRYFASSLPALINDSISISELVLKKNMPKLFTKLDEICKQQATGKDTAACNLHEVVLHDHYNLVESLLKHYSPDSLNAKRQTPLMLAASKNNTRIMELLLSHGAVPDHVDLYGHNALHYALLAKAESAALFILPTLHDPNRADRYGVTPLSLAAAKGLLPIVHCLSSRANYTEVIDDLGRNALHYAASEGQVDCIKYLVKQGFNVDQVETPILPSKIKKCLKRTPLHLAVLGGHAEAAGILLSLGADPQKTDTLNYTVCEHAVLSKNVDILRIVQQLPSYHSKEHHARLLQTAAIANNGNILRELILDEVDLNSVDEEGFTALHLAAMKDSGEATDILLQASVTVDMTDIQGNTALHVASQQGHVRIIEALLTAGANINKTNYQKGSPLFLACEQGHLGAVVALLKNKADVTIANNEGITPKQIATVKGHTKVMNRII